MITDVEGAAQSAEITGLCRGRRYRWLGVFGEIGISSDRGRLSPISHRRNPRIILDSPSGFRQHDLEEIASRPRKPLFPRTLLVALMTLAWTPGTWADDGLERHNAELTNLDAGVTRLAREYANPLAIVRQFPYQKRLIDARVFFELGNYESAAIVLLDLIESPTFKGNLEFDAAQLLLGQCLLKVGNLKAAKTHLEKVARGPDIQLAEKARFFLIEMALDDGSVPVLRAMVDQMGGMATSDRTRYGLGKALIRLGEAQTASMWLKVIQPQSPFYLRARYYLGVAHTMLQQYPQALDIFRSLTQVQPKDAETTELVELSWLAVGRLYVEQDDTMKALTSYQHINRNSKHYEVALYEMAWSHIKAEKYDKALETVDILLLTVKDEQINVDAHVLRGRLNITMDDYEQAEESYEAILGRFAPIRNELTQFSRDPTDIQSYFTWLLTRHEDSAQVGAPLSPQTSAWIESTDSVGRVAKVFERISDEARDIKEAQSVGRDLERILSSSNRVELFGNLKEGWTRALALETRLVVLSSEVLDSQNAMVAGRINAVDADELNELVAWRRGLDEKVKRLPTTFEQYQQRQGVVSDRFMTLQRKGFIVEQNLAEVRRQLLAIEKFVNDKQFADFGEKMSPEKEAEIRASIADEKQQLKALFDELIALKQTISIEARSIGTGGVANQGEENLKHALYEAHKREGMIYDRLGLQLGGEIQTEFARYAQLRGRIDAAIIRLDQVIAAIDSEVGTKAAQLRGLVARELNHLAGFDTAVGAYHADGRSLAEELGEELFRRAQARMDQVVLEADVGILDVAWERKRQATRKIREVSEERANRSKQLKVDLDGLKADLHGSDPASTEANAAPAAKPAGKPDGMPAPGGSP